MKVQLVKVIENIKLAHQIYKITLQGDIVELMNEPGQFVNIKIPNTNEFLLRRPISICEINKQNNTFVMIYRAGGDGTKILSRVEKGSYVDVLGPLGRGYDMESLEKGQTALLVGGGIGVPPLYELAKQFRKKGVRTIHVLGFNNERDVFYEKKFAELGATFVSTADGSYGEKGFVTDIIKNNNITYDKYYSCGPLPMLKALKNMDAEHIGYVSLEERMACGVGACYACVCEKNNGEITRVCYDGPVYKAEELRL